MTLQRVEALARALELSTGKLPEDVEERGRALLSHADRRLAAGTQTVVALAGATGSGKSSLFNALSGTKLAEQSPRRPTTSTSLAVSFAATNTSLLDLLQISRRREAEPLTPGMENLVLVDLPDHDSTARAHRDEVDKMVQLVDQFVWVLDPQKYADAAIHQRYLAPLAQHRDVIMVVLNQADRLSPHELEQCLAHIKNLLAADGLADVPVLATSALTGQGIDELRNQLIAAATHKKTAAQRLEADVVVIAQQLARSVGQDVPGQVSAEVRAQLTKQLSAAAGVPIVVNAVAQAMRHRGRLATGWPMVSWLGRLRPDPLRRLRLGTGQSEPQENVRSSLPSRSATAHAQLTSGLRSTALAIGEGLPQPWQESVTAIVQHQQTALPDELDRAVVATDLGLDREPVWWRLIQLLQWLCIAAVAVGVLWIGARMLLPTIPDLPIEPLAVPLPTALLVAGLAGGALLHLGAAGIISFAAGRAARKAAKALNAAVAQVAEQQVLKPAQDEIERYRAARAAVLAVQK